MLEYVACNQCSTIYDVLCRHCLCNVCESIHVHTCILVCPEQDLRLLRTQMLGNVRARKELGEEQGASFHFTKKERGSEKNVACLKSTVGGNETRTHFDWGYFWHISFAGWCAFSSLKYPHGPSSSSCRTMFNVMFLVWPFLTALFYHPSLPQHSSILPLPSLIYFISIWPMIILLSTSPSRM